MYGHTSWNIREWLDSVLKRDCKKEKIYLNVLCLYVEIFDAFSYNIMMKNCKLFLIETMHKMFHNISKSENRTEDKLSQLWTLYVTLCVYSKFENLYLKVMQMPKHRMLGHRDILLKENWCPSKKVDIKIQKELWRRLFQWPLCNGFW